MGYIDIIGIVISSVATFNNFAAYLDQTLSTVRTKNTKGLSLITFSTSLFGCFLWLVHNSMVASITSIISSGVMTILIPIIISVILLNRSIKVWKIKTFYILVTLLAITIIIFGITNAAYHYFDFTDKKYSFVKIPLGITAGFITSFAFLPQIIRLWKVKDASSIRIALVTLYFISQCLWTGYWLLRAFGDPAYSSVENWISGFVFGIVGVIMQGTMISTKIHFDRIQRKRLLQETIA